MANDEHVALLKKGVDAWNAWRMSGSLSPSGGLCVICGLKNQDSSSVPPNFILFDASLPDVAKLVTAMVQARDAVERRSWSHPQEPTSDEWWADVLADPRARKRERRTDLAVKQAFYGS